LVPALVSRRRAGAFDKRLVHTDHRPGQAGRRSVSMAVGV